MPPSSRSAAIGIGYGAQRIASKGEVDAGIVPNSRERHADGDAMDDQRGRSDGSGGGGW